jgi:predicted N-acyltransferase
LAETGFDDAIEQYCKAEAEQIEHYMQWAQTALPYKTSE